MAHYELSLLSGATASGKTGPSKKPPAIGSELCVLYEPDRSRHNALYPLSLVRARSGQAREHRNPGPLPARSSVETRLGSR